MRGRRCQYRNYSSLALTDGSEPRPTLPYNGTMCPRIALVVIVTIGCVWTNSRCVEAQSSAANVVTQVEAKRLCRSSSPSEEAPPTVPATSIAEVTFPGPLALPLADQQRIATAIKEQTYDSTEAAVAGASERARNAWQDRGYFLAKVSGNARTLTSNPISQRIALGIHVEEGLQYRLGAIEFKNNKAVQSAGTLRNAFPIKDGEIFRTEKIRVGLQNLRRAYGETGYVNFVPDLETKVDDLEASS